ncbi:S1 RNA-binding domain-containing protein [Calidifontibacillus erzurumensis]|uniref:S1 RNA-binding domain-containing protein n=1 Tax=Calidifontibacillus erzurumensis TaxID=2741433 RepID=UPI0035B566A8
MTNQILNVLIEGYDENVALELERNVDQYDKDWETVYSARQNQTILQAEITGIEEKTIRSDSPKITCAVVMVGQVKGLIPLEYFGVEDKNHLLSYTGKKVAFKVIGLDAEAGVFIGSRKAAIEHMANVTWAKLEKGKEVIAVVRRVGRNRLIVDIGGIEAKINVADYDYGWIEDLREHVKVGQHLKVKVTELDKEKKIVKVSRKETLANPWLTVRNRFEEGNQYVGTVSGVVNFGNYVNLAPGIDSLAPHMRFQTLSRGDKVLIRIKKIHDKEEKIDAKIIRKIN